MKPGTILHEQYLIGTVLGQGGLYFYRFEFRKF